MGTLHIPTFNELIENEKAKTIKLKKDIAAQPYRNRDKNYQFLISIGYKPDQLALKTPKQLEELVAIESKNYHTESFKADTRTKQQRQYGQKEAKKRLEDSKKLKDAESASTIFQHIPVLRTLNASQRSNLNKSLGNQQAAKQADIETGIDLIGDVLDLGFGLKSPTSLATSYLGDWIGGTVGSQYGRENLGRFIGSFAGGFTPEATSWLYRKVIPRSFQLAREMNQSMLTPTETLPLNIGWGPKQTIAVTHKSNSPESLVLFNPERWDVVNEGANPLGIWFQGNLGVPRTIETGATAQKAAKAEKARNLFATRPYTHSGKLTLEKPIVTVGEVPNRSTLSYQAEQMGADGLIYNNVYDNGYDNNQVILSFRQPNNTKIQYPPYEIKPLPGYQIKSLFIGSPLEKQLSKNGTISVKQLQAYINRNDVPTIDKEMLNKVLQNHTNDTHIDYNTLRQEVQDMIPKYTRVPQIGERKYQTYGASRLGFDFNYGKTARKLFVSEPLPNNQGLQWRRKRFPGDPIGGDIVPAEQVRLEAMNYQNTHPEKFDQFNTFTFESSGIKGNTKHYQGQPLGHSRTYTTVEEPDVLYVMESQSDWAQTKPIKPNEKQVQEFLSSYASKRQNYLDQISELQWKLDHNRFSRIRPEIQLNLVARRQYQDLLDRNVASLDDLDQVYKKLTTPPNLIQQHMKDTYLQRQLQENLMYAAQHGQHKMRYPTPETAAKIEGYTKQDYTPEYREALNEYDRVQNQLNSNLPDEIDLNSGISTYYNQSQREQAILDAENRIADLEIKGLDRTYSPQHQTILKKYSDFPKQYQKLFGKKVEVRTVTDNKGNTWYEVDVPESYLNGTAEMLFKKGGKFFKH